MEAKKITVQDLSKWLKAQKTVSILDVRTLSERDEWYIPGSVHLNAYDELKSGNMEALSCLSIDKNVPVVTLCARGVLSFSVAEALSNHGFEAYSLEGGMKAWNYANDSIAIEFDDFKIIQVRRVAKGCLSYLIGSKGKAMVIDASLDPEVYLSLANAEGWQIVYVADTHIHADYVSRTIDLASASGAAHLISSFAKVSYPFRPLNDKEVIELGDFRIKVLHTPGHTWDSTSFLIEDKALLSGDTLFTNGIGRPDLKSDQEQSIEKSKALYDSLQLIKSLDDAVFVLPAHSSRPIVIGEAIITEKLGTLKSTLQALNLKREQFVDSTLSKLPTAPPNYLTIAEINKSGQLGKYNKADLEAGANRCAIS